MMCWYFFLLKLVLLFLGGFCYCCSWPTWQLVNKIVIIKPRCDHGLRPWDWPSPLQLGRLHHWPAWYLPFLFIFQASWIMSCFSFRIYIKQSWHMTFTFQYSHYQPNYITVILFGTYFQKTESKRMKHHQRQFWEHLCNSSHCSHICPYLVRTKSQSQASLAVLT